MNRLARIVAVILIWLVIVAIADTGVCAMCAAFTPSCLAVGGVFLAMFFCPVLLVLTEDEEK